MTPSGPLRMTPSAHAALRPVDGVTITGGLWRERRQVNRTISVPGAWGRLQEAGNIHNLELAAGTASSDYVNDLPFLDSDLYKWLEAVGWTLGDPELAEGLRAELTDHLSSVTALLATVQADDGYLDSHFQVRFPGERFRQLAWGHELYCAGHLIQAAVATHRAVGDEALLAVARRVADLVVDSFGREQDRVDGVCGHPEIETALVELYRETGHRPYLDRALFFVDRRGHGLLAREGHQRFGPAYFQDHTPVREAASVEGHAVRQLYLLAGVVDVYLETGDETLLAASERLWTEMVATKTYLTGGIGAHHSDEAFGAPYELPNERSYCETCAAIASIMHSWRMLVATGGARYADLLERTLYNGFLAGLSLDGQRYIYANPLQVREGALGAGADQDYARVEWFRCACCPPNVMRLLASLPSYVALTGPDELVVHQYVSGTVRADVSGGGVDLVVRTGYPWDGTVALTVAGTPAGPWTLRLRVPLWAGAATVAVNGVGSDSTAVDGWVRLTRTWQLGDEVVLVLPVAPRLTRADGRVDADRGQVAIERGPVVYCVEGVDHPGVRLDDLVLDTSTPLTDGDAIESLGGVRSVTGRAHVRDHGSSSWWPYRDAGCEDATGGPVSLRAVPYYAWGNRGAGPMRVWLDRS